MKNKILFVAMLLAACMCSIQVRAQLEVKTSGNVQISQDLEIGENVEVIGTIAVKGAPQTDNVSVNVSAPGMANSVSKYGVYSYVRAISPQYVQTGQGIGLYGRVGYAPISSSLTVSQEEQLRPASLPFYAGVVGVASAGIGVYGTNGSLPTPTTPWTEGNYAGYFNGDVKVTGLLNGVIFPINADRRNFENISQLGVRSTTNLLSQLNPISYTLSTDSNPIGSKETKRVHYGFVAQELQTIAPELVYEDGAGYLSINYMELIPLLVQKVQELSAKVEELEKNK